MLTASRFFMQKASSVVTPPGKRAKMKRKPPIPKIDREEGGIYNNGY